MRVVDLQNRIVDLTQHYLGELQASTAKGYLESNRLSDVLALVEAGNSAELISQIKSLISRLKRMIGEVVSSEETTPGREMATNESEVNFVERSELAVTHILEKDTDHPNGAVTWNVTVLKAGPNKSGLRDYQPSALESASRLINESDPKVPAYIDHPTSQEEALRPERSVRDMIGWFHDAKVVGSDLKSKLTIIDKGINEKITLAHESGNPGFMGISIRGNGKTERVKEGNSSKFKVHEIVNLYSADVVTRPGAGGGFHSLAEAERDRQDKEDLKAMDLEEIKQALANGDPEVLEALRPYLAEAQADPDTEAGTDSSDENKEETEEVTRTEDHSNDNDGKEAETEESNVEESFREELMQLRTELQAEKATKMLETKLSETSLPDSAKARIRKRFEDKTPTAEEVSTAVQEFEEVVQEISDRPEPRRYGTTLRISESQQDKWQTAFDAMLEGTPEKDGEPAFRSLRHAYQAINGIPGDRMMGPEFAEVLINDMHRERTLTESYVAESYLYSDLREAELQTGTFTNIFGTSMKRMLLARYHNLDYLNDWRKIVGPNIATLQDYKTNDRVHMGGFANLSTVAQGVSYPEFANPSEELVQYAATKRGNVYPITREAILADDLNALQRLPRLMADSAGYTLYQFVFDFIANNSTYDSDSTALIAAGHSNNQTAALTAATLMTAVQQMRVQTGPSGSPLIGVNPRFLLVPPELEDLSYRLTESAVTLTASTNNNEPNIFNRRLGRYNLEILVIDYWTDADNWFVVADPNQTQVPTIEVGFINGQQDPQLFVQDDPVMGSNFTADKITWKIRHEYGGDILDYRGFAGSIV